MKIDKRLLFPVFLAAGLSVFLAGAYYQGFPAETRTWIKIGNSVVFSGLAWFFYRSSPRRPYYPVALAFALSAAGFLFAWLLAGLPSSLLGEAIDTPRGWAIAKVIEAVPLVLPALALVPRLDRGYPAVYLQRGQLGKSLGLGLGMSGLVILVYWLTSDVGPKLASMVPFLGWMLVFSLANSFMEEFLLRGLFLRKYEAFFSPIISLLLSALIFTSLHYGASYLSSDALPMLLAYTFMLGLGNGAIMQQSDSIWGAVLAHTVADMLLMVSVFGIAG